MTDQDNEGPRNSSQAALYKKIEAAAEKLPTRNANEAFHTAKSLANLAIAWRYLSGGPQPGGANTTDK